MRYTTILFLFFLFCIFSGCNKSKSIQQTSTVINNLNDSLLLPINIKKLYGYWEITKYEDQIGHFNTLAKTVDIEIQRKNIIRKTKDSTTQFTYTFIDNILTLYKTKNVIDEIVLIERYNSDQMVIISNYTSDRIRLLLERKNDK